MLDLDRYFVSGNFDYQPLLDEWQWLLGSRNFRVFRVTCMGDLFLLDDADKVYFLDTMEGELAAFATDLGDFERKLQDRHVRRRYLATFVVRRLFDADFALKPGECFSPDRPPILGGTLSNENLSAVDVLFHSSIMGQIHRQVKSLPPGTPISDIVIE